ncbi:MAG: serine hydrolase [Candidatus Paceibacterota bacterium]
MIKPSPAPLALKNKALKKKLVHPAVAAARRISLFMVACSLSGLAVWAINDGQMQFENLIFAQISDPVDELIYRVPKKPAQTDIELSAKSAYSLIINAAGRERVVFEKDTKMVLPIASLTKLMSATVVLENPDVYDLDKTYPVSLSASAQDDVPVAGNLKYGEVNSVRQLLGLMLYYSSNDAAYALSEIMGVDEFVAVMNHKAADLGLGDTVFYNPSGLDGEEGGLNQSSAEDLMVLVKYILRTHPEIFSYTANDGSYVTENGIFSINLWDGQRLAGGKTGYTEKAGGCMIYIFENESNRYYINILLGAASPAARVVQMQKLVNFASNLR